jgi:hypothetical protein
MLEFNVTSQIGTNISLSTSFNGVSHWWWLRSPGTESNFATRVGGIEDTEGFVHVYGRKVDIPDGGVRPAVWIEIPNHTITKDSRNNDDSANLEKNRKSR